MGRLIDADKLIANMSYDICDGNEAIEIIKMQPTAYDVDKVVEIVKKGGIE